MVYEDRQWIDVTIQIAVVEPLVDWMEEECKLFDIANP